MSNRREYLVIGLVLMILLTPAVAAITGPSHIASSGVTYQTNSGLEVTLNDEREVEAVPFADNQTFAHDNATLSSPGTSTATVTDQTFGGDTMAVPALDASSNPITLGREDLSSNLTVAGGASGVILHDVALDDGSTDVEFTAASSTTLKFENVPDTGGIQVVDSNGEIITGTSSTSGGTATFQFDAGEYDIRLQEGTSQLEIRDLETQELINGTNVSVEVDIFGDGETTETFNTSDGTIDWTGLPADERFAVTVDAGDDYYQRTIIIPSLVEQSTAYMLNTTNTTVVEPRFTLEDPSNQFDSEESEIVFERAITINGSTEYVAVTGDRIGINGFDATLVDGQRYRVTVRDPDSGAERRLGEYTATATEQVTLTVQDVEFDSVSDTEGIDWTARYLTNENSADEIEFIFRDDATTDTLDYEIYERGNQSNVLTSGSASGNVTITEVVPPSEENTVFVVEWTTTRASGETITASRPVSTSRLPVGPNLDPQWQTIISMIGLFAVAGLFGAVNPGIGGLAVATTGGMFFFIGWLPDSTGGLMVVLALFVGVLAYVGRRARGATA